MYELDGKVAPVTGAGGTNGIGRGIATRLVAEAAPAVVCDLKDSGTPDCGGLPAVVDEINAVGGRATGSTDNVVDAVDEVFSPEQLGIDIVEHAWRILRGIEPDFSHGDVVALVRDGLADHQYLTADATLDRFRAFRVSPGTFDRRSTASWLSQPKPELDSTHDLIEAKIASYEYELDGERQRELRRIIAEADRALRR